MTATLSTLQDAFASDEWPRFDTLDVREDGWCIRLWVSASVRWFEGHFPEQAVLAGVVQTHWATRLSEYLCRPESRLAGVDALKFQQVVLPEQHLTLNLQPRYDDAGQLISIRFRYADGEQLFSEGRLVYTPN